MIGVEVWYTLERVRTIREEISVLATDEDMAWMKADNAEWEITRADVGDSTCTREVL